jgi:hypothetical protein
MRLTAMKEPEPSGPAPKVETTPFQKFDSHFRSVISVPKAAIDREEAKLRKRKRQRAKKNG